MYREGIMPVSCNIRSLNENDSGLYFIYIYISAKHIYIYIYIYIWIENSTAHPIFELLSGSIGWGAGLQSSRLVQSKSSNPLKVL